MLGSFTCLPMTPIQAMHGVVMTMGDILGDQDSISSQRSSMKSDQCMDVAIPRLKLSIRLYD